MFGIFKKKDSFIPRTPKEEIIYVLETMLVNAKKMEEKCPYNKCDEVSCQLFDIKYLLEFVKNNIK